MKHLKHLFVHKDPETTTHEISMRVKHVQHRLIGQLKLWCETYEPLVTPKRASITLKAHVLNNWETGGHETHA